MPRAKRVTKRRGSEVESDLQKLIARLTQPGVDRWEAETARVRHLVSIDAHTVMQRLTSRHDEAVGLFSRLRTRDGLIELCRSHFGSATFSELARLTVQEQAAVFAFHEVLDALRWYVRATEDMPSTVKATVIQYVRRLEERHRVLVAHLGPPGSGHRVLEPQP